MFKNFLFPQKYFRLGRRVTYVLLFGIVAEIAARINYMCRFGITNQDTVSRWWIVGGIIVAFTFLYYQRFFQLITEKRILLSIGMLVAIKTIYCGIPVSISIMHFLGILFHILYSAGEILALVFCINHIRYLRKSGI
jgi:hypothetical protein